MSSLEGVWFSKYRVNTFSKSCGNRILWRNPNALWTCLVIYWNNN